MKSGASATAPFSKAKFLSRDHLSLVVLMANWCRVVSLKTLRAWKFMKMGPAAFGKAQHTVLKAAPSLMVMEHIIRSGRRIVELPA